MRFIDNSNFTPPVNWITKVDDANQHYVITGEFKTIWRDIASELNKIVRKDRQYKCWYSEVLVVNSDIDVDHFRPKGNVKALTNKFANLEEEVWEEIQQSARAGYHFVAFDWRNFRVASQHCNQGRKDGNHTKGKKNFFPLKLNSPIASNSLELDNELHCLLDPCKDTDAELIRFSADGSVDASYPKGTWEYCRAKVSIEVFHLNYDLKGLTDARKIKWNECSREINDLMNLYYNNQLNLIENQQKKLLELANPEAAYSAVVIDCIRHHAKEEDYILLKPIALILTK